jgi:hypothetical protein
MLIMVIPPGEVRGSVLLPLGLVILLMQENVMIELMAVELSSLIPPGEVRGSAVGLVILHIQENVMIELLEAERSSWVNCKYV